MHSDYKVKRSRRADNIGRIAEPIVCCGSERDGRAETIVFYEVEHVWIADIKTIGRIAEPMVFAGPNAMEEPKLSYSTRWNAVE